MSVAIIPDFVKYQIEWLTSHKHLKFEPVIEDAIVEMLKDTGKSFIDEQHAKTSQFDHTAESGKKVCVDTISRQAALDALDEQIEQCNKALGSFDISPKDEYAIKVERASLEAYKEQLENMPSAQPEVIRCTECKHYREYDSEYVKNAVVVQCMADRYPISEIIPDGWFCAGAERKDDE